MNQEPQAIEVEVVEIDGVTPPVKVESSRKITPDPSAWGQPKWQQWGGNVRKLDSRWWPLWVILGIILIFLLLTVGVVAGVVFLVFRILRGFLRAISA